MKRLLFLLFLIPLNLFSQTFKFAQVTDTHVGGATGADDLRRTVLDLNQQQGIDFVILSGDVTEFGSDEELALAKQILDSLNLPLYVIPGNHDSNWSESGANSFRKVFGSETFFFEHKGVEFIGTTSGPNMRMSPGQIPRENLVWMDSIFKAHPDQQKPLIAINHYPLDSSLNNWYENINRLKTKNVQLALCGHGHINKLYDWEGIPGVMARSNLRAKDEVGGYNIVSITPDSVFFQVRKPLFITEDYWLKLPLQRVSESSIQGVKRPNYAMNSSSSAKVIWEFEDHGDIGAGISSDNKRMFTANTVGEVYALDLKTGKKLWSFKTGGKVYSTPAVHKGVVVVGSSDHYIYGLDSKSGKELWKLEAQKAVLGSPAVKDGKAFIGASDGVFRSIDVKSGKLLWTFDAVEGYVSTLPTLADNKVIFGSWKNGFYALDQKTGKLVWKWDNGHTNRMFSAAACYPVIEKNKVFIVAPDRFMTAIDLQTGKTLWREKKDEYRVRESMGISKDRKLVLAKTMDGELIGVPVDAEKMDVSWKAELKLPYELAPTAIYSNSKYIFVPSDKGLLSAVEPKTGKTVWQYKISNAMINPPLVFKDRVVVSSMDGKIVMLKSKP
ncbi:MULTISPECIES: outer membrane protein assembly factor BamB family protein [Sphingobacterium]|uniref:Serine/threonine protein kinase n=1 Tax=Sphingobacterium cellulitidis TaxID=1768011 RepID=A0A8H9FW71_9SPHI|nr:MULTISPECIES: PQQ-binding-like beta-propeller repeat protein [Sphingobacterium]MBA8985416.1 outer membrane protein assembly factor BamB/predicted MPP superfamily phosphohydrolase [Sphingobacterium soli]WFB63838.1 PQQ-binding-like beta-propeller repeat protein [Sphingobacterium sp. WM]GGE09839.1 serine/threonine protein kinase [Sphingobacterium soli]